jgi:hypothetical protein
VAVDALLLVNGTDNLLLTNATDELLLARSSTLDATLLTSSYDNVDRTSYTTASISPAADSLLLLFVTDSIAVGTAPRSVPTGLSLTWQSIGYRFWNTTPGTRITSTFIAQCGASPGSGTITLTENDMGSGTTSTGTSWVVIQITGHHVTQPVRQHQYPNYTFTTLASTVGTSHTIPMLDAADSSSRAFSYFTHIATEATTFRTNWTELSDDSGTSPNMAFESQWRADEFETTASATWATGVRYHGIALEIAEVGAASIARATRATYAETTAELTSSVSVVMPSGITAGDLLIAYTSADANATVAAGGGEGWTSITDTSNGSAVRLKVHAKIAAGSDALTLTLGSGVDSATYVERITNHGVSNVASDIEVGTPATGTSAAPDPPSVTPSSSKSWLVVACNASDDDDNATTYWPTGYVPLAQTESGSSSTSAMMQVACDVQATGSAINPGVFALAASEEWVSQTLLIPPVSAGATGTVAVTEEADTSTASGTETFTGTSAATDAADTSTATGTETFTGTAAVTEADDTSAATGTETFTGTSATTEEADTSTASGTHIENVTGSAAITEADDTSTASGTETFTGTSATTEADDTSTASGTLTITGTIAVTEAADTSTASGTVTLVVLGDISAKLHPVSTFEPAAAVSTLEPATTVHTFAPATTVRTFNA